MGKKEKYEDNRDIFEKALDEPPTTQAGVGAVLGAVLGRKIARIGRHKRSALASNKFAHRANQAVQSASLATAGAGVGAVAGQNISHRRKK